MHVFAKCSSTAEHGLHESDIDKKNDRVIADGGSVEKCSRAGHTHTDDGGPTGDEWRADDEIHVAAEVVI